MKKNNKKIIAVIGMAGSGKTEAVSYLQKKYNWPKIYLPQPLFDEIKKNHLEINWKNESKFRSSLREKHGKGVFAKLSLPIIKKLFKDNDVIIIESLYGWDEYKIIKKAYPTAFKVLAVYASPEIRFNRLKKRPIRPIKTSRELKERDYNEIEVTDKGGPIALADYTIINEKDVNIFYKNLNDVIKKENGK